ncbi:MAG: substrate-binding domain-containing protein [Bacteroidales bacterium]|nr:substrate-binding domain-containing protein [Bacteroidales bacterium]
MFSLASKRIFLLFLLFFLQACKRNEEGLIIFHAGSLSSFVENLKKEIPTVKIINEASGSVEVIRKAISLRKPCDVLLLSDARLIDSIPDHLIKSAYVFAYNSMVLAYHPEKFPNLTTQNWINIFSTRGVKIGRSNPCLDPSGYRALIILNELSKRFPVISNIIQESKNFIRPKETDLIVYFNLKNLDAMITYKSIALENQFHFIDFPDSLNFGVDSLDSYYRRLCVNVDECGHFFCGSAIAYILIELEGSTKTEKIVEVLHFLQSQSGQNLLKKHGFRPTWIKIR